MPIYLQISIISHDWRSYGLETSKIIDTKCKENATLLFKVGLVYTWNYNDILKRNSQKCILFYLPYQETLNNFGPINILLALPGCKEVQYDSDSTNQSYFYKGLVKTTVTCNAREKYTICLTICKDNGNSMESNNMLLVQYIIKWVVYYLHLIHHYQWLIIIIQCGVKGIS